MTTPGGAVTDDPEAIEVNVDQLTTVLADDYLAGVEELDTASLRAMRNTCETEEHRVSYARRILQGRIDLLRAEAASRSDETGEQVVARLSDVLADQGKRTFDPASARPPSTIDTTALGDDADVAGPADLSALDADELTALADEYTARERELSATRRRLFDVIDRLQAEVAERYRTGAASVSDLLTEDG